MQSALKHLRAALPDADFDGVAADLSDAAGVARVTQHTSAADILVNNAGIYGLKAFFDIDDAEWEHYFQMNVMSGVRLARHYLKGMIERNAGRIVFISSESGLNIPVDMIHYGFTKTAQLSIARGLAKLAAGTNVTVNSVLPGPTMSDGVRALLKETADETGRSVEDVAVDFVRNHRSSRSSSARRRRRKSRTCLRVLAARVGNDGRRVAGGRRRGRHDRLTAGGHGRRASATRPCPAGACPCGRRSCRNRSRIA